MLAELARKLASIAGVGGVGSGRVWRGMGQSAEGDGEGVWRGMGEGFGGV